MPLNDLASFTLYIFTGFHVAAGEKQRMAYDITIWGLFFKIFFYFAAPSIVGANKMLFWSQMLS